MKKILVLTEYFLPGYNGGGPVRTMINISESLGKEYDFRIVALDRDLGDTQAYDNIKYNEWVPIGNAKVMYIPPKGFTFKRLRGLIKDCDIIYNCCIFRDFGYKTLILHRLNKTFHKPVVVASMGIFSKGALAQKSLKKKVFIGLCKMFGLFKNITWSVTSELESDDVKNIIGQDAKCIVAEDLPRSTIPEIAKNTKEKNILRVVFLSRICPMKNLLGAINILSKSLSNIKFYICGPDEDKEYFNKCKIALNNLPNNIEWEYRGNIHSEYVQQELSKYDVLLLPTLGENYCHVVFEALSVGCIPVISDTTPWLDLDKYSAGFVLPLNNEDVFVEALDKLAKMDAEEIFIYSNSAIKYAKEKLEITIKNTGYRKIFDELQ